MDCHFESRHGGDVQGNIGSHHDEWVFVKVKTS